MKVALILSASLQHSPYAKYYIDIFSEAKIEYDIISWDRNAIVAEDENTFVGKQIKKSFVSKKLNKYTNYFHYKKFIIKKLYNNKYDAIIVFTIQVALLLKKYLLSSNIKYIFDIRDYSIFNIFFNRKIKKILKKSQISVVSSKDFEKWLKKECIVCHNIDSKSIVFDKTNVELNIQNSQIKISSIGSFLEYGINKELLKIFHGDKKVLFCYIGCETNEKSKLIKYIENKKIHNTYLSGAYKPEDSKNIYKNYCDFVNIIRKNTLINRFALPNKLYNGILLGKPIITNEANISVANYVKKYNLGIVIQYPFNKTRILQGIEAFDNNKFQEGRLEFLQQVLSEQENFKKQVKEFLMSIEE